MTNHIHLIIEPNLSPLHVAVHAFSFRYAQYFNRRYKRRGYLFQGRFRSIFIQDGEYLKRLTRYIHRNPIESGMVHKSEEYKWSSHRAYLGLEQYVWLSKDFILSRFGVNEKEALENFIEFVNHNIQAQVDMEEIFKAHRRGAYGSPEFLKIVVSANEKPSKETTINIHEALQWICEKFQVTEEELRGEGKSSKLVDARSLLAYLGRCSSALTVRAVAQELGKNEGTLSRLASRAEKRMDLKELASSII